MYILFFHRNFR